REQCRRMVQRCGYRWKRRLYKISSEARDPCPDIEDASSDFSENQTQTHLCQNGIRFTSCLSREELWCGKSTIGPLALRAAWRYCHTVHRPLRVPHRVKRK